MRKLSLFVEKRIRQGIRQFIWPPEWRPIEESLDEVCGHLPSIVKNVLTDVQIENYILRHERFPKKVEATIEFMGLDMNVCVEYGDFKNC